MYDFERWYKLIRKLQPDAVIAIMGPDVRWVGTETGHGRETEWSVVPVDNLDLSSVAAHSQQDIAFKPQGDMQGSDLGSRDKIKTAKGLVWYPAETDVSIRPGWFYHESQDDKIKTPQQLLDIYFHSVGRNGVLLLNIPPDKRGLIHENDVQSLREWKNRRDAIFKTNLAKAASLYSKNGKNTKALVDGKDNTYLKLESTAEPLVVELQFERDRTFNVLTLQENIRMGQRIESFVLDYWKDNEWKMAAQGTTVGYKRLLRFNEVTASKVRLRILSSRLDPAVAELGLYYEHHRSRTSNREE